MTGPGAAEAKHAVRERIWTVLEREGAAPPGVHGHIPDFVGADDAARRLAALDAWRRADVVKANPDRAQLPVRVRALRDGKLVFMAVPRLATPKPFYRLDPAVLPEPFEETVTGSGAASAAPTVGVDELPPIDLVVCGSVAVNHHGVRVGKGAGYSDIEVALLIDAGLITSATTIVTTVHPLQVVDDDLPEAPHDFSVDWIVTSDAAIQCQRHCRPSGITRTLVDEGTAQAIPALRPYLRP